MSSKENPIESDVKGDLFLWGTKVRIRDFDTADFPLIQTFVAEIWAKVEMCDLLVDRVSITKYKNSYGVVALPSDEFKGIYARGRIHKCGKCNGGSSMSITAHNPHSVTGYEKETLMGQAKTHEFGCEYYLVQNIMEM